MLLRAKMRRHTLFLVAASAVVTLAVLALTGHLHIPIGARLQEVLSTLSHARPEWVIIALFWLSAGCFVRALRWYVLIRPGAPKATIREVFNGTIIGFTAVVLFGRPGELVRPYLIGRRTSSPFSCQVAAWVLERVWDLLAVILIFASALTQIQVDSTQLGPGLQWVLRTGGSVAFGLAIAAVFLLTAISLLSERVEVAAKRVLSLFPARVATRLQELLTSFVKGTASTRQWSQVGSMAALTAVEWVLISAQTYSVLKAFAPSHHLGLTDSLVFLGFVAFGSIVQVPGVGGGVQVAAALVLAEIFGLGFAAATAVAIGYWLLSWAVLVPPGLVLAVITGVSWRSLRRIEAEDVSEIGATSTQAAAVAQTGRSQ